jgi:hypothetical protein
MAESEITYRRLPGKARKRLGLLSRSRQRLWLAEDHVLLVCTDGYSESCKRFYLRDIQAMVVCRTVTGVVANIVLGSLSGLFGLLTLLTIGPWGWGAAVFAALAVLFVTLALVNFASGPTCVCRLHTAVQTEHLTSLGRLRTALRVVQILRPLIESAQGQLTSENLDLASDEHTEVSVSTHAITHTSTPAAQRSELRHEHGEVHAALFYTLLVGAALAAIDIAYQSEMKNLADSACFLAEVLLLVFALRRQHQSALPKVLRHTAWAAAVVLAADLAVGSVFAFVATMAESVSRDGAIVMFTPHIDWPAFKVFCAIDAAANTIVAIIGLSLLREFRAAYARALNTPDASTNQTDQGQMQGQA